MLTSLLGGMRVHRHAADRILDGVFAGIFVVVMVVMVVVTVVSVVSHCDLPSCLPASRQKR